MKMVKRGQLVFLLALTGIIPIHAQDFCDADWKSNIDVVESGDNGEYRNIPKIEFTDNQGNVIRREFPYLIDEKYLKIHATTGKILNVTANIYYAYLDDKLSYGLIDTSNADNLYDEIVTRFTNLYGAPQKQYIGQGTGVSFGSKNNLDSLNCLLIEDASAYMGNGRSLLGVYLLAKNSDDGTVKFSSFTTLRSRIFVFANLVPDHITILMIENISHLEGLYDSESSHIIILDNDLYYYIYNPLYNTYNYIAFVNKYKLSDRKVYQYTKGSGGFIYLSVEGIDELFVQGSASSEFARKKINELLSFNKKVDDYKLQEENSRRIIQ
jgi:hypothetical protein